MGHHGYGHHEHNKHDNHGQGCGCGGHGHRFHRRFYTPKEKAARLKEYLEDLKAEVAAVEKRVTELEQEA